MLFLVVGVWLAVSVAAAAAWILVGRTTAAELAVADRENGPGAITV